VKHILLILPLVFTLGCASNQVSNNLKQIEVNNQNNFSFGSSIGNIGKVEIRTKEASIDLYFDKLPQEFKFDLCKNSGVYQDWEKVIASKNGKVTPIYKTEKVNCDSKVVIYKSFSGNYVLSYNLNILSGYRKENIHNFEKLLPHTSQYSTNGSGVLNIDNIESKPLLKVIL
jgi:hypothetical protein